MNARQGATAAQQAHVEEEGCDALDRFIDGCEAVAALLAVAERKRAHLCTAQAEMNKG